MSCNVSIFPLLVSHIFAGQVLLLKSGLFWVIYWIDQCLWACVHQRFVTIQTVTCERSQQPLCYRRCCLGYSQSSGLVISQYVCICSVIPLPVQCNSNTSVCGLWFSPCWLCRYWSDPKVLSKLSAAMGTTFDPTAMGAAEGDAEGPPEDEEEELDVHGAASAGKLNLYRQGSSLEGSWVWCLLALRAYTSSACLLQLAAAATHSRKDSAWEPCQTRLSICLFGPAA